MTITSLFSPNLIDFLQKIEDVGFKLCLVGGAPRDYLMDRSFLSQDLDFELRGLWITDLKIFLKAQKINYTELPYEIIRVDFEGCDLEFSTPRTEKTILDNKTHHHFSAELNPALSYKDSFKRRDFTINAIGIELDLKNKKEVVVDPYEGVNALMSKTLKEVSPDFFFDSVRFLRLIRFMIKYNLEMAGSIESNISKFDLSELSVHHFTEEMMKSLKPGIFINAFNNLVQVYDLFVPVGFNFWRSLKFLPDIESKDDLLVDSFLQNESAGHEVVRFFSMPESRFMSPLIIFRKFLAMI
jgi:tRNA nucleotidyltransferase/poly(A) polymerase